MKFKGNIVITDPCYIFSDSVDHLWDSNNINIFENGQGLENYGFIQWIWEDTLYGDWSCTTYSNGKAIGKFCADAGLVGVFYLDEILKFNPDYDIEKEVKYGLATLIEGFEGDVCYGIDYDEDDDGYEHDSAYIKGTGNIPFHTKQTGL